MLENNYILIEVEFNSVSEKAWWHSSLLSHGL